jgi:hypothetical protein
MKRNKKEKNQNTLLWMSMIGGSLIITSSVYIAFVVFALSFLLPRNGWINSTLDNQPGEGLGVDYLTLIYGTDSYNVNLLGLDEEKDDFIVPVTDEISIFNKIFVSNSTNKVLKGLFKKHIGMTEDEEVDALVTKSISKSVYN